MSGICQDQLHCSTGEKNVLFLWCRNYWFWFVLFEFYTILNYWKNNPWWKNVASVLYLRSQTLLFKRHTCITEKAWKSKLWWFQNNFLANICSPFFFFPVPIQYPGKKKIITSKITPFSSSCTILIAGKLRQRLSKWHD